MPTYYTACMATANGTFAVIADDKVASTAEAITAAALSELVRQTKRQTALLEALLQRLHVAEPTAEQAPAPIAAAAAAAPLKPHRAAASTHRTGSGGRKGSSGSAISAAAFTVEELRSRARVHNHLLDTENSKSRAILALLRDDGSVPQLSGERL